MKIELSDISGLPEELKAVVETEGDKRALDLSKLVARDRFEEVQSKYVAVKDEAIDRRKTLNAWKELGESPDEVRALIEKAKGTGKGAEDAQAKLDAMRDEYEGPNGKMTALNQRLQAVLQSSARASLQAELAKVGFIPEAIDDITASAMGRIQFSDDGSPKVMTADGKPMIGSGPDHGATLADLAAELAASKPYAVRDGGTGGGGKPPGSNGGKPGQKTIKRAEFDAMPPAQQRDVALSGASIID